MRLKTNLHFHTEDDPEDVINYTFYEGINKAAALGFEVIGLTCHHKFIDLPEYVSYAADKGILLIPGVERDTERRHTTILNCDQGIEKVNDFKTLAEYKRAHPEIFILAPHPYFGTYYCLGKKLEENIRLFDAIESSWFYSKNWNRNIKAEKIAKKYDLPFIASSDTHDLRTLNKNYTVIDAKEKTAHAIFEAIRNKQFENVSAPSKLITEMLAPVVWGDIRKIWRKLSRRI